MDVRTEKLRCWAEIDLAAIQHNVGVAKRLAGPAAGIMAIVKANAYGHGQAEIVEALREEVTMFGVANVREAQAVAAALAKRDGATPGIFILGPALPFERAAIVAGSFVPAVSTLSEAAGYSALSHGRPVAIHLAIDTGMGRMGVEQNDAVALARQIAALPNLALQGIGTHLPVADDDEAYTRDQLYQFDQLLAILRAEGIHAPTVHSLNSAGLFGFPGSAWALVRAGLMLYGSSPLPQYQEELRPALALKTRITLIRDLPTGHGVSYGRTFITPHPMRVATLAIGYADGWDRHLSSTGVEVLIRGRRCPMLGRVTMDQIMVDVSAVDTAAIGDEAVLIGRQGNENILAAEVAKLAGTIAWEVFTSLGPRVDRVYHHGV